MRNLVCGAFLLVALALTGCGGSDQVELSGDVLMDGKPLPQGAILLVPTDTKGAATGGEIKDGKYALTGKQAPKVGSYKVEIRANKKSGRQVQKSMGKPGELEDELMEGVAPEFNTKTKLTVEVKSDARTADFKVLGVR